MPQCSNSCGVDLQTVTLGSVTIFWEDLGIPTCRNADMNISLSEKWDDEIAPWLIENVSGYFNPHEHGVWFAKTSDALLFKLTWAGRMLEPS